MTLQHTRGHAQELYSFQWSQPDDGMLVIMMVLCSDRQSATEKHVCMNAS